MRARKDYAIIAIALLAYGAGFFLFYPRVLTNRPETDYLLQAKAFAEGRSGVLAADPVTGAMRELPAGRYAPGASLLMAPLVAAFGWRGAYLVPFASLLAAALIMARWLAEERRSPLWAMLLLSYPSSLVLGRVAVCDVPSLALVCLVLWLFWRGQTRSGWWWVLAGALASVSLLLRETNAVVFVFLFAGTAARREPKAGALVLGGLLGLAVFFGTEYLIYGSWFKRSGEFELFGIQNVLPNLPYYALTLLVFIPGGWAAGFLYQGPRRPEMLLTVAGYSLFFLAWNSAVEGGLISKIVLQAPRFSLGLVPLLIFALAEVAPRLQSKITHALAGKWRAGFERAVRVLVPVWLAGTVVMAAAVHPLFGGFERSRLEIIAAIAEHTAEGSVIISNPLATSRFINELYMDRSLVNYRAAGEDQINMMRQNNRAVFVVFLYRSDSDFWREKGRECDHYLRKLSHSFTLVPRLDQAFSATDTLRVWEIKDPAQ